MWESLGSLFSVFLARVLNRPKVKVEILNLDYVLIREALATDPVLVISPYPSRYNAEIAVSNVGASPTSIKNIELVIENKSSINAANFKPFKIEPGEYKKNNFSFPINENEAIRSSRFELRIFSLSSKPSIIKGDFPIKKEERRE